MQVRLFPVNARLAEEQAALRRVAVLVARGTSPEQVFGAVAEEVGRLLVADSAILCRYDPQSLEIVGTWTRTGAPAPTPIGVHLPLGGRNVTTLVHQTGQPARIDYDGVSGVIGRVAAHDWGLRSSIGVPVSVAGRLWGVMVAAFTHVELFPADTEARLTGFTELIATALANAQARTELQSFAEEQAALRRVAVVVARGASPGEMFAAVTREAGHLLGAAVTILGRYEPNGKETTVGVWSTTGSVPVAVGTRTALGGRNVSTLVFQTGTSARIDDYGDVSGAVGAHAQSVSIRASVGVPVRVEGRLWGVMIVASTGDPLPAGTETRLAGFTELAATAIAGAQAHTDLRGFAEEQAALGRVATLVAGGAPPQQVFTAVTDEAGRLLQVDYTVLSRYDPDGLVTVIGAWARIDPGRPLPIGLRLNRKGRNIHALVFETGRSARIDDYGAASGAFADTARAWEFNASVGVPIQVEGRLWGVLSAGSRSEPLPPGTEARLTGFTELAATALANAEAQAALTASRARIVAAADQTRRRVERDLHDGAQQRLVSLALHLRAAQATVPPNAKELAERLEGAIGEAMDVQEELREISHGLHPAVLTESGLRSALRALARRSTVPVRVDVRTAGRMPEPVEIAAYFAVFEALTNTAKHARASAAEVEVAAGEGVLRVRVSDDGCGGADFSHGSGLTGLKDRVEAFGGRISLHSPPGAGTALEIILPLDQPAGTLTSGP